MRCLMENTSPKKLRAKLKDYLDLAKKEIIRIKRRSGQRYILISEEKFNELKTELTSLQKRLLGKNQISEKLKDKTKEKEKEKAKAKSTKKTIAKDSKVKKATRKIALNKK